MDNTIDITIVKKQALVACLAFLLVGIALVIADDEQVYMPNTELSPEIKDIEARYKRLENLGREEICEPSNLEEIRKLSDEIMELLETRDSEPEDLQRKAIVLMALEIDCSDTDD